MATRIRRSFARAGLATVALAAAMQSAQAAAPLTINFQGRLSNSQGAPQTGAFDVQVRLFPQAGGGACFVESHDDVPVRDGIMTLIIGGTLAGGISGCSGFVDQVALELEIAGETLSPRLPLYAAPYAFFAGSAAIATSLRDWQGQPRQVGSGPGNVPRNVADANGVSGDGLQPQSGLNADLVGGKHASQLHNTAVYRCGGSHSLHLGGTSECLVLSPAVNCQTQGCPPNCSSLIATSRSVAGCSVCWDPYAGQVPCPGTVQDHFCACPMDRREPGPGESGPQPKVVGAIERR